MTRSSRTVADSRTEHYQMIMRQHLNGYDRVFGGFLLSWIDQAAAVTGRRHTLGKTTTAMVDEVRFLGPVIQNDTVVLQAHVTWVGKTSLEVRVEVLVQKLDLTRTKVGDAYVVLVGLDDNERPRVIPTLEMVTEEEKEEFRLAAARMELRRKRRELEKAYADGKFTLPA